MLICHITVFAMDLSQSGTNSTPKNSTAFMRSEKTQETFCPPIDSTLKHFRYVFISGWQPIRSQSMVKHEVSGSDLDPTSEYDFKPHESNPPRPRGHPAPREGPAVAQAPADQHRGVPGGDSGGGVAKP